jgi:NADH dehydrogenase
MHTPRTITIFGGTGFIGRHVIRRLAKTGAILRVPTRDIDKALPLKPMGDVGQIVPVPCNVCSDVSLAAALAGSDSVINLIGILFEKKLQSFEKVHVETAARIARIAHENGVKDFVHLSALGASTNSTSSYARSKAAGERGVHMFFPDAVIMRPSVVFGAEDNFINLFATLACYSSILPLIGGGHTKFQPVYVGDVAEAMMRVIENNIIRGRIFELGGARIYTFREIMEMILRITNKKRLLVNLPWALASMKAFFWECLPHPLLTRDQVRLLKTDNVVQVDGLHALGIAPTSMEIILPTYLERFR